MLYNFPHYPRTSLLCVTYPIRCVELYCGYRQLKATDVRLGHRWHVSIIYITYIITIVEANRDGDCACNIWFHDNGLIWLIWSKRYVKNNIILNCLETLHKAKLCEENYANSTKSGMILVSLLTKVITDCRKRKSQTIFVDQ